MLKIQIIVLRFFVLVAAALALYELVPNKLAAIQARSALENSSGEESYKRVLAWNNSHKEALANLSEIFLAEEEYEQAIEYAFKTLSVDPTNGRAMAMLVRANGDRNSPDYLEQAVSLSPRLWSAHSYVHSALADYWAQKGEVEKVLAQWDLLITRHRSLYKPIFPVLNTYANAEETRYLLTPYVSKPAKWWSDFFIYMVNNKAPLPVIQHFYQLRAETNVPLEDNERKVYVSRLQKAKLWKLAYSTWIGGLDKNQFSLIGSIYDGGFESDSHNTGFDWYFSQSKQAKVTLGKTRGISGKRALHVVFNKRKSINFRHVWQRLLLIPGKQYEVSMRTRVDSLKNTAGLVWQVSCADETSVELARSEALTGRRKWDDLSFEFTVPEQGCDSQIIRLKSASKYHHEQFYKGSIWFDDIKVKPVIEDKDESQ